MQRIAISGSSGYIGSRLINALIQRDDVDSIIGLDVRPPGNLNGAGLANDKFKHVSTDVRVPFAETFVREQVDTAVHLAFSFSPMTPRRIARAINLGGTRNFLNACVAAGVERAVVLNSAIAYGALPDNPDRLTETCPLRAKRPFQYSYNKRLCDEMCSQFLKDHPDFSLAWLRPPLVFGSNVDNYVSRLFYKPKVVYARGYDPPMQFIHEDDLCAAIIALLESDCVGPFNVGPDDSMQFTKLAWEFKRAPMALPAGLLHGLSALTFALRITALNESPPGSLDYLRFPWLIDSTKFHRETGFRCTHSSLETVRCWRQAAVERANAGMPVPGKIRL